MTFLINQVELEWEPISLLQQQICFFFYHEYIYIVKYYRQLHIYNYINNIFNFDFNTESYKIYQDFF